MMRAGLLWLFTLRRFLALVGLGPLVLVWALSGAGLLPGSGMAWGLAAAWPVLMAGLVWHYRSLMVLNDILVFAVLLLVLILLSPWTEARLARSSAAGDVMLLAALAFGGFVLWLVLHMTGIGLTIRSLARKGGTRRLTSRATGPVDPAVAFDALRLVPGRTNDFATCGPLREDGWFAVDFRMWPYDAEAHLPAEDTNEDDGVEPAEWVQDYARIIEEGPDHQVVAVAADDGSGLTCLRLHVRPHGKGCVVDSTETTDLLDRTGALMYWLKDFGRLSFAAKLDHLAGRPCRYGAWTNARCVLTDLGNWFSRRGPYRTDAG
jgi:hypothetical protein